MSCPPKNEDEIVCIEQQLKEKLKTDLKNREKTIKYSKGSRSLNWKLQYEAPLERP